MPVQMLAHEYKELGVVMIFFASLERNTRAPAIKFRADSANERLVIKRRQTKEEFIWLLVQYIVPKKIVS